MGQGRFVRPAKSTALALTVVVLAGCGNAGWGTEQYVPEPARIVEAPDCLAPNLDPGLVQAAPEGNLDSSATPSAGPDHAASPDPAAAAQSDAPKHAAAPEPGSVPAGFEPELVVQCENGMGTLDDEHGRWSVATEKHLRGDLNTLVAAFGEPSDRGGNLACTADMEILPAIWLVDASGRAMRAAWPTDACGKSKPGVHKALDGLEVVETVRHRRILVEPRAALDAGCAGEWTIPPPGQGVALTPEVPMEATAGPIGGGIPGSGVPGSYGLLPEPGAVDAIRVCRYAADPIPDAAETETIPGGGDLKLNGVITLITGTFTSGEMLSTETSRAITEAAWSAPESDECTTPTGTFAVLWPLQDGDTAGAPMTVELGGCERLFPPDGRSRSMSGELLDSIAGSVEN